MEENPILAFNRQTNSQKKKILSALGFIGLIFASFATVLLVQQRQDIRQRAQVAQPTFTKHSISGKAGDCKIIVDIDKDGDLDVVLGGHSGEGEDLKWYSFPEIENSTNGNFIASPQDEFTTDCAAADVDGDGDQDIIAPDGPGNFTNVIWFKNPLPTASPSTGTWTKNNIANSGDWTKDVHPADFDKDGLMDVAIRVASSVRIYYQDSGGTWQTVTKSVGGEEGMGSGDIDKDGDIDLILQGVWWENNGTRTLSNWPSYTIGSANGAFKAHVDDIDRDGIMDVLFSSSENTANIVWFKAPNGNVKQNNWTSNTIKTNASGVHTLQSGDMDGDGDTDVVAGHMHTFGGLIYVYYNSNGLGTTWQQVQISSGGIHNGKLADIDRDGDLDLYGANWTGNNNHMWLENNLDPSPNQTLPLDKWTYKQITNSKTGGVFGLTFGDYNKDGMIDVFSGNNFFTNPGGNMTGTWTKGSLTNANTDAKITVDVDGDQNLDVVAYGPDTEVYWLEYVNNSWNLVGVGSMDPSPHGSGQGYVAADFIPGGRHEIVFNGGEVGVDRYKMQLFQTQPDPQFSWTRTEITNSSAGLLATEDGLDAGDIDGDGRIDIVTGQGDGLQIVWWRNTGSGWTRYKIGTLPSQWTDMVRVRDFNNDGKPDVVFANEGGNSKVHIFINQGGSSPSTWSWQHDTNDQGIVMYTAGSANIASLDAGDMDNDGDMDVVIGEMEGQRRVIILENIDSGLAWTPRVVGAAPAGDNHVGTRVIDLDNDGDRDIVSIGYNNPQFVHLWRNDAKTGGGTVSPTPTIVVPTATNTPMPTNTPTPSPTTIPSKTGDLNGDNQVGILDLSILLSNWGSTNPSNPLADLNADGTVGILDLSVLLSNWGS